MSVLSVLCAGGLWAIEVDETVFANDFPVEISFAETYVEKLLSITDGDYVERSVVANLAATRLSLTAGLSISNLDPTSFDEATPVSVAFGNFSFEAVLGDDPEYAKGKTSARFELTTIDGETGEDVVVGSVSVRWNGGKLNLSVSARDPEDFSIAAPGHSGIEEDIDEVLNCTIGFASCVLKDRPVYTSGQSGVSIRTVGSGDEVEEYSLASVSMSGSSDSTRPTVQISSPKNRISTDQGVINVSGEAGDDRELVRVMVAVNGNEEWVEANLDESGWSLEGVELLPGRNQFLVKAEDADGNESKVAALSVDYVTALEVTISGQGSVTKGFLGSSLRLAGNKYTVQAVPGAGYLFDGWTGSISGTERSLSFTYEPGMALQANFIVNPFGAVKGSYSGLIKGDGGSLGGLIGITLTPGGGFTGKVTLGGVPVALKGTFSNTGHFTGSVARKGASALLVDLQLDLTGGSQSVIGTIQDGEKVYAISGDRNGKDVNGSVAQVGNYTVLLPGDLDAGAPRGVGYARVTVVANGEARWAGVLGDGTKISGSSSVSSSGNTSLYLPLYANGGALGGQLTFRDLSQSDLDGELIWLKPGLTGFDAVVDVNGGKYVAPAARQAVLVVSDQKGNVLVSVAGADDSTQLSKTVTLSAGNKITVVSAAGDRLTLAIAPATGLMSGSFIDPATNLERSVRGVVQQKANKGGGLASGGGETGELALSPQ